MKAVRDTFIVIIISLVLFVGIVLGATRILYGEWPKFSESIRVYEASRIDYNTKRNRDFYGDFHVDRLGYLGWAPAPGQDFEIKRFYRGKKIWEITAKVDEFGYRVTPQDNIENRKKHLIVMGDSNTFGEGLTDDKTISAELARMYPDYRTYNFAMGGYSSNQGYAIWEYENPRDWVKEEEGILLYNFLFPQFGRVIGNAHDLRYSHGKAPRFIVENGKLKHIGSFSDDPKFILTNLLVDDLKWPADLFRMFSLVPEETIEINVALIKGIKEKYLERFPKGQFVIYFLPAYGAFFDKNIQTMISRLKEAGIAVYGADRDSPSPLAVKFKGNIRDEKYFFEDGHTNYEGVKLWTQELDKYLRPLMN